MTHYIPYKEKYEHLKQDFNELSSKFHSQQGDLNDIKEEVNRVIHENSNAINRLKSDLKICKESSNLNSNQFEQTLSEKEE